MYPVLRLATTVVASLRAERIASALDTVTITLPVHRGDVEATRMNNGRYLTLMDLGRFALTLRGGFLPELARRRWYPLVTGVMVRFIRSLRVGTTFDLSTRIVCWDRRQFFIEQWFEQRGDLRARAFVKAVFMGPGGPVASADLLRAGRFSTDSPAFPEAVRAWQLAEQTAFGRGASGATPGVKPSRRP